MRLIALNEKLTAIRMATAIIRNTHRMQIAPIHCLEQCFSHTIKWPAIIRKIDATVAAIIPMVAIIIIIIIVKRQWSDTPMGLTLLTSISCRLKGSTAERLYEFMLTTTRIQNNFSYRAFCGSTVLLIN